MDPSIPKSEVPEVVLAIKVPVQVLKEYHIIFRAVVFRAFPSPKYDYQGEGRVVVEVSVDRSGKVVQAIPGTKGSTTLDEYLA